MNPKILKNPNFYSAKMAPKKVDKLITLKVAKLITLWRPKGGETNNSPAYIYNMWGRTWQVSCLYQFLGPNRWMSKMYGMSQYLSSILFDWRLVFWTNSSVPCLPTTGIGIYRSSATTTTCWSTTTRSGSRGGTRTPSLWWHQNGHATPRRTHVETTAKFRPSSPPPQILLNPFSVYTPFAITYLNNRNF